MSTLSAGTAPRFRVKCTESRFLAPVGVAFPWLTTTELRNRHSSCRAVSSSIRVAVGGKRKDTAWSRASQRFSMGLRSGEYADHAIRLVPSLSR
ncbi:uncharacterized protein TNCV_3340841 [Trichonephila clavipes]|nr:uncharacterized protein TNCV_3340841 [Trichonephila clavipes]